MLISLPYIWWMIPNQPGRNWCRREWREWIFQSQTVNSEAPVIGNVQMTCIFVKYSVACRVYFFWYYIAKGDVFKATKSQRVVCVHIPQDQTIFEVYNVNLLFPETPTMPSLSRYSSEVTNYGTPIASWSFSGNFRSFLFLTCARFLVTTGHFHTTFFVSVLPGERETVFLI